MPRRRRIRPPARHQPPFARAKQLVEETQPRATAPEPEKEAEVSDRTPAPIQPKRRRGRPKKVAKPPVIIHDEGPEPELDTEPLAGYVPPKAEAVEAESVIGHGVFESGSTEGAHSPRGKAKLDVIGNDDKPLRGRNQIAVVLDEAQPELVRAHNEDGTFKADDPATLTTNEAFMTSPLELPKRKWNKGMRKAVLLEILGPEAGLDDDNTKRQIVAALQARDQE